MLPAPHKAFLEALREFMPDSRIYTDALRTLAYGTDASVYRLTPKIVVDAESENEVSGLLRLARKHKIPVTFRAAGTSLSGQAVTDSVLVRLGRGAGRQHRLLLRRDPYRVVADGEVARGHAGADGIG